MATKTATAQRRRRTAAVAFNHTDPDVEVRSRAEPCRPEPGFACRACGRAADRRTTVPPPLPSARHCRRPDARRRSSAPWPRNDGSRDVSTSWLRVVALCRASVHRSLESLQRGVRRRSRRPRSAGVGRQAEYVGAPIEGVQQAASHTAATSDTAGALLDWPTRTGWRRSEDPSRARRSLSAPNRLDHPWRVS